jgi:hypothetical protein
MKKMVPEVITERTPYTRRVEVPYQVEVSVPVVDAR